MRAHEFLPESHVIQPQWLQQAAGDQSPDSISNPGKRVGSDGTYKWSPPLQQQLDLVKDIAGTTDDDTQVGDCHDQSDQGNHIKSVLALIMGHGTV